MKHVGPIILFLIALHSNCHAQWGQCDVWNRLWFQSFDTIDYDTLENQCDYPPAPMPVNNCGELGAAFVTYSDAAVLDDGSVEAFASSQDFSEYSATAIVQINSTVTMPDGSTLDSAAFARSGGYTMMHMAVPVNTTQNGDIISLDSSHELNWPGCDGFGMITFSHWEFEIATTKSQTNFADFMTNQVVAPDGTVSCMVNPWCTPDTSPPACSPAYVDQRPQYPGAPNGCKAYYITAWLAERSSSSQPWNCFPLLPLTNAVATADPSLGVCKK